MKNFYKKTLLNLKKKKNLLYSNDNVHFVQIQMWKSIYNQQAYAKIPEWKETFRKSIKEEESTNKQTSKQTKSKRSPGISGKANHHRCQEFLWQEMIRRA